MKNNHGEIKCSNCSSTSIYYEVDKKDGCIYWKCNICQYIWKTDRYGKVLEGDENNSDVYSQMKLSRCKELEEIRELSKDGGRLFNKNDRTDLLIDIWEFEHMEEKRMVKGI